MEEDVVLSVREEPGISREVPVNCPKGIKRGLLPWGEEVYIPAEEPLHQCAQRVDSLPRAAGTKFYRSLPTHTMILITHLIEI